MLPPSGLSKLDCRAQLSLEKSPSSGTCDSPAVDQEVPRWHRPPIPTLISQPPRLPGTSLSLSAPDSRSPLGQLLMTHQIPFFFFFSEEENSTGCLVPFCASLCSGNFHPPCPFYFNGVLAPEEGQCGTSRSGTVRSRSPVDLRFKAE